MLVPITEKTDTNIKSHSYLVNTIGLFYRLNILKLSDISMYKSYILRFKAFHVILPITLDSFLILNHFCTR